MINKKILTLCLKAFIGFGSFGIIYWRLQNDFTSANRMVAYDAFSNVSSYFYLTVAVLLFPVNWLIESYKWMLITQQTQKIDLMMASKSVYAGVCVGNLAPGRATEFLAKIHFFKRENKLTVTVLHFVNGMFQLSVTIFFGILSLLFKSSLSAQQSSTLNYVSIALSVLVIFIFVFILLNINKLLVWIYKRFNKDNLEALKSIKWTKSLLIKLFGFSILRYIVFASQFLLIMSLFSLQTDLVQISLSVCIYFLFTTIIPMFSLIEAAVRTAIALVVFSGFGISNSALAISAILLWIINIVFPSIVGYVVLLKENLTLKSFSLKKQNKVG